MGWRLPGGVCWGTKSLQSCLTLRPVRDQRQELLQADSSQSLWVGGSGVSLWLPGWHLQDAGKHRMGTGTNARVECTFPCLSPALGVAVVSVTHTKGPTG